MKCPACKGELRKKNAGNMELDVCLGGCGGIWYDQHKVNFVDVLEAECSAIGKACKPDEFGVKVGLVSPSKVIGSWALSPFQGIRTTVVS